VSIGAALAEARQRAGLAVAQVSERTRIRETVIRGIEGDDYSGCGGDFYARGHIRSIAKAVGADPGALITEYDAHHRPEFPSAVEGASAPSCQASAAPRCCLIRSAAE
jgi:cytoskeletal protein RodZ